MEGFGYEKKIRIMIVDENAEFRSYTANKLREEGFDVVLTTSDPKNALDAIEATSPDVVLFDLIMVGLDGIAFLEQAGKMPFAHRPRFIATSTAVNEMMIKEVMRLGASYFLVKPINYSILTERIHQICSVPERKEIFSVSQPEPTPEPRQVYIEDDLEKQVTESILEIGIPAHVKGYHYVRSAIMLAVTDPEAINAVTKIIYPTVAKQYKTSPSRVERGYTSRNRGCVGQRRRRCFELDFRIFHKFLPRKTDKFGIYSNDCGQAPFAEQKTRYQKNDSLIFT